MRIKRINELFDDEDLRDRLEVPHLRGELDLDSGNWKDFKYKDLDEKFLTEILYNFPILNNFHIKIQEIDDTKMFSFYATTKEDIGEEYYCQLSIALHEDEYYSNTIFRLLEDLNPKNFVINEYQSEDIDIIKAVVEAFLKTCERFGVLNKKDLEKNIIGLN